MTFAYKKVVASLLSSSFCWCSCCSCVFSDTVAVFPVPDVSVTGVLLLMLFVFNHAVSEVALSSLVLISVLKSNPVFKI